MVMLYRLKGLYAVRLGLESPRLHLAERLMDFRVTTRVSLSLLVLIALILIQQPLFLWVTCAFCVHVFDGHRLTRLEELLYFA